MAPPKDPYQLLHFTMMRIHEIIKCGYNNIVTKLDNPPTNDLSNFFGYCETWNKFVEHHHSIEERLLFPFLMEKMDLQRVLDQHKPIHEGLGEIGVCILESKADHSKFDAEKLKGLMVNLREPLFNHLDEEVNSITQDKVSVFDSATLDAKLKELEKQAMGESSPFVDLPFMRSHAMPEYKDDFPPLPWFVRKILLPYYFARRNSGYWAYSPYGM